MKTLKPYRETLSMRKCASALAMSACLALLLLANSASAATIAQYTFDTFEGPSLEASGVDPNATATAIEEGGGLSANSTTSANAQHSGLYSFLFSANDISGKTFDGAQDANDYITFTVSAKLNYMLNLSNGGNLSFWGYGNDFDARFGVTYATNDGDTYNDLVTSFDPYFKGWKESSTAFGDGFDGLSSITFRIYGWKIGALANDQCIDDILLSGAVVPVPEVGTMGPSMLVIGLAIVSSLRFRKNKTE